MLSELMKHYRKIIGKESAHSNSLRKGFYSLDGFEIYPAEKVGVIVHPFFIFTDDILANPNSYTKSYLKNFYGFLNEFEGPVLTLEEGNKLEKTMDKYRKSDRTHNRFFVKTKKYNPQLAEIEWNDAENFIREFNPKKLKMAGGYCSYYKDSDTYGGCLGGVINALRKDFKNIEVVEGCTF